MATELWLSVEWISQPLWYSRKISKKTDILNSLFTCPLIYSSYPSPFSLHWLNTIESRGQRIPLVEPIWAPEQRAGWRTWKEDLEGRISYPTRPTFFISSSFPLIFNSVKGKSKWSWNCYESSLKWSQEVTEEVGLNTSLNLDEIWTIDHPLSNAGI